MTHCLPYQHMCPLPLVVERAPRRHLSVHEHYSLEMLSNYGIAVPQGELAYTPDQAKHIAVKLGMSLQIVCFPGYPAQANCR